MNQPRPAILIITELFLFLQVFVGMPKPQQTIWTSILKPSLALLLLYWLAPIQLVQAQEIALPDIGNPSGNILTPAEEERLGRAFMRSIRSTMPVIQDPLLSAYIQSVGDQVVKGNTNASGSFEFFLINSPQINAFAGPGGHIGVYSGLITTTESESELASVIAHEIAHVTQKHLVRTYDAVKSMSLPAAALAIAAVAIGAATNNTNFAVAAATGVQAGLAQREINFTRSHEEEADSIGIKTLATAGFDPTAMPVFFSRMGKASRLYDNGKLPEFLRSHPVTTNRIADAYGRANDYPYKQRSDSLGYHLARERLRVLAFNDPREGIDFYSKSLEEGRYRNEESHQYGYALSLIGNRQYSQARELLAKLTSLRPTQIEYLAAKAELDKLDKQPEQGLKTLEYGLAEHPGNYPLSIYLAQALLDIGKPQAVQPLLENLLSGHPDDTLIYKLLAQAAGDSGNKTQGHQYLAEYYYHTGALKEALMQLEIALKDRNISYYESARMAARLKEIRQEKKDLDDRDK
ncbi:MAG: M48 family metalloprotease [Sedimenticola sp.]|uniref:Putative beta-barrel assembly-enhancing protease n=1 Tax=Sedimenticola thiotaurini TaxID=1543721 RepID=A0A558CY99_9GAMM|nr:M48 family metalloprotease [Sedimenticola sp.]TVT53752.1 MAG: M48 family metallopeptidase [Sedimenticola thiotaurini]MCW8920193.1 M48 family metalloprotease [Sedimenticola sp.]MCW8946198.1 M48 family metalloprotease [Sedimenticola sp.]MCW8948826.1 M48 family metalloprotease [Sedimenticola sp.]